MLNKFLARGLGGGRVVGSSGGCSKGVTARRAESWTDSGEKREQWVGGGHSWVSLPPSLGQS